MKKKTEPPLPWTWASREKDLARVIRYDKFKVMFYRTNLHIHSLRVPQIVQRLLPDALRHYPELDAQKALLISKFHDDHEIALEDGDVSFQLKLMMSGRQLSMLKQKEIAAAERLSCAYGNPRIEGYAYRDLLMHALLKDCPEAQLYSFADKLDAYGEAWHEVLAGNACFLEPVINYVASTFNRPGENFPLLAKAFESGDGFFAFPVICTKDYFSEGLLTSSPHDWKSVARKTKIPHYEMWKKVTLEQLPNGMKLLTEQKEWQPPSLPQPAETPAPKLTIAKRAAKTARSIA